MTELSVQQAERLNKLAAEMAIILGAQSTGVTFSLTVDALNGEKAMLVFSSHEAMCSVLARVLSYAEDEDAEGPVN